MFPFQESNPWMPQVSCDNPSYDYESHLQNLFAAGPSAPEGSSGLNADKMEETHQKLVSKAENVGTEEERKIMHRDLERERRKQMASLLTNLRSVLPLEFLKGRRTRADLLNEAERYIKHLRGQISELQIKRDALKRLSVSNMNISAQNESSDRSSTGCVVINPYPGGLEIVISSCFREENLQLSGVMRVLLEESIEVESCASTKVNERMFHTIQSKVDDSTRIDLLELQQKLYRICNSGHLVLNALSYFPLSA